MVESGRHLGSSAALLARSTAVAQWRGAVRSHGECGIACSGADAAKRHGCVRSSVSGQAGSGCWRRRQLRSGCCCCEPLYRRPANGLLDRPEPPDLSSSARACDESVHLSAAVLGGLGGPGRHVVASQFGRRSGTNRATTAATPDRSRCSCRSSGRDAADNASPAPRPVGTPAHCGANGGDRLLSRLSIRVHLPSGRMHQRLQPALRTGPALLV